MLIKNFIWDLQRYVNSNIISEEEKYVKKFSMLVLEVLWMDEEDKLHYFIEEL
ncbi:unnamed protein product [Spirodela intermedia]|uniref:Uncharacterized protein n=1 Tax=Spirodela intermedia TaxID=51605 RepID=A0A7I8LDC1_SPIIN|nr:unnamed protein product [Spirodela intermedia]